MISENDQLLFDSISGCLFGGAYGDALGYPVEFLKLRQITEEYGKEGITELVLRNGKAEISDDTQMTLYTANGLLYAQTRAMMRGISGPISGYVHMAYKEWYASQVNLRPEQDDVKFWVYNIEALRKSRAPGNTCLSALASWKTGTTDDPINDSKGCGGVMRVAPVGCFAAAGHYIKGKNAAIAAADIAALTHGHPLGYIPAAYLSYLIYVIITNRLSGEQSSLEQLLSDTGSAIKELYGENPYYSEFEHIIDKAAALAGADAEDTEAIAELGGGWVAEEALAIALYAVLKHRTDFKDAIVCAVNHDGDSDSTGAIAGNILGAYLGMKHVDRYGRLITKLEAYDVIYELAQDMTEGCRMSEYGEYHDTKWMAKYVAACYGR
ncbi:MAG: ADP-ribosylglycohydrolase family protein [Oscillospiraceae bacterium]|nr:ADP-ribosylglycohydrolase family protein [Oscillospiraceae bacterium]